MCERLGVWARIYALNEFSMESSYHSLFAAWRELGLVDKCGIPHKIGFIRNSLFGDKSLQFNLSWSPNQGISSIEGPYPHFNIPTAFQWCYGAQSRVVINCPESGVYLINLSYYSTLFDFLEIKLIFNDKPLTSFILERTEIGVSAQIEFKVHCLMGSNLLDIFPDHLRPITEVEHRALTFMLKNIELHKIN
jgi:hypothetical protein